MTVYRTIVGSRDGYPKCCRCGRTCLPKRPAYAQIDHAGGVAFKVWFCEAHGLEAQRADKDVA